MNLTLWQPSNTIPNAKWLLWNDISETRLAPFSEQRWSDALEHADRILAIGAEQTLEIRRLSGRGWRGVVGSYPSSNAPHIAYAGSGSLKEPRLDCSAAVEGVPPPIVIDHGPAPLSGQTIWLPFLAHANSQQETPQ